MYDNRDAEPCMKSMKDIFHLKKMKIKRFLIGDVAS